MAGKFRRIGPGCYHTRRLSSGEDGSDGTGGGTSGDFEHFDFDTPSINPQNFDSHIIERTFPPEIVRPEILARLKHLSGRQLCVVLLHFYGDMTQQDIAEQLGVSQQMVAKILRQARDKSRKKA